MEKIKIDRVVIVEGKYDQVKLASLIDGVIIKTDGFRIYKDKEKADMIRTLGKKKGLLILTDSDHAGFQLRGYIRNIAKGADIKQVYIPQIKGKERRKEKAGKEGLLGVEGMNADLLRELLQKAGVEAKTAEENRPLITKADFFVDGLSGGADASEKRAALLKYLGLPAYLTANALLEIINSMMTYEEYRTFCDTTLKKES